MEAEQEEEGFRGSQVGHRCGGRRLLPALSFPYPPQSRLQMDLGSEPLPTLLLPPHGIPLTPSWGRFLALLIRCIPS